MALPKTGRIVIAALVLMLWTFVGVPGVAAAPVGNPGVQVITQTCNGVDYQFAVKHAGRSANIRHFGFQRGVMVASRSQLGFPA